MFKIPHTLLQLLKNTLTAMTSDVKRVDEGRRSILRIFIGLAASLGAASLTVAPIAALLTNRIKYVAPAPTGAIEVTLCEDVENCPEEYSVPIHELRRGPVFKLLRKDTLAIPVVFGLVQTPDGREFAAAYNIVCTHFGCPVNPTGSPYLSGFACPCHGSVFTICTNPDGCDTPHGFRAAFLEAYVSGGPAPRSLRPVKVIVKGDRVYAVKAYI